MRRKLIVGNWKMHGSRAMLDEARSIAGAAVSHDSVDVALCPPFTLLSAMVHACPTLAVGAQDCHSAPQGAFTGSVSAPMLVDTGAALVIIGHSERRSLCRETSADVRAKCSAALAAGLRVILCIGEELSEREAGRAVDFVLGQLRDSLPPDFAAHADQICIAYEPVWAIGTGRTAQPDDIVEMHAAIRAALGDAGATIPVLYGGSVNAENAADIVHLDNVDGALVGGASLTLEKFAPIIAAAVQVD